MAARWSRGARHSTLITALFAGLAGLGGCEAEKAAKVQVGAAVKDPSLEAAEAEDHAPGKDEVAVPRRKARAR